MAEVYGLRLDSLWERQLMDWLLGFVSDDKRERIGRFRKMEDAQRSLAGDLLARSLLCSRLKLRNDELTFTTNAYGKPSLQNAADVHFNLSHAGDWVVCALDDRPVGIDVEIIQPIDLGIADRFFSREELADLHAKPAGERLDAFFDLWTLKESYMKAVGKGMSLPLDAFSIRKAASGKYKVACTSEPEDYAFRVYSPEQGYKLAVCSEGYSRFGGLQIVEIGELSGILIGKSYSG